MTDRRDFLSLLPAGVGAMLLTSKGEASLIPQDEINDLKLIGKESEFQMLSRLQGNAEPGIHSLDFAIQFASKGNCFLNTNHLISKDESFVSIVKKPYEQMSLFIITRTKEQSIRISFRDRETSSSVWTVGEISIQCVNYILDARPDMVCKINEFIGI